MEAGKEIETIIEIVIMALAIWRLSAILTSEEFIFGFAQNVRKALGVVQEPTIDCHGIKVTTEIDEDKNEYLSITQKEIVVWQDISSELQPTLLTRGITCVWCVSWWLSIVWTVGYLLAPSVVFWVSLPFSLSALAVGYERIVNS